MNKILFNPFVELNNNQIRMERIDEFKKLKSKEKKNDKKCK
jgi:hypothetical protein